MKECTQIKIQQVQNGYIVYPDNTCNPTLTSDNMVFQSFAELTMWLSSHFNHRSKTLKTD